MIGPFFLETVQLAQVTGFQRNFHKDGKNAFDDQFDCF